jgi:hypothetical protein
MLERRPFMSMVGAPAAAGTQEGYRDIGARAAL